MTQEQSQTENILYQDQNVKITDKSVYVLKFYFPQDSKNQISFTDINKLAIKEMDEMDETLGVDSSFFQNFKTKVQENKNMYIEMAVEDESVRLSFAPKQPLKVFQLIEDEWENVKIQKEKQSLTPLQNNTLYTNVQVTPEKIQEAMKILKKSSENNKDERKRDEFYLKKKESKEGASSKNKVKGNVNQQNHEDQNKNPSVEVA